MTKKLVISECCSHPGYKYNFNEDAYAVLLKHGLWIVADGMGGHNSGSIASNLVVSVVSEQVKQGFSLLTAIQNSHKAILLEGERDNTKKGMGSTVVALKLNDNSDVYEIAAVGDSRAYLFSNHSLKQITRDHSLVQELINQGEITQEQAKIHPDRNILRQALGSLNHVEVKVDIFTGIFNTGDILLLCTDGLTNRIQDHKIKLLLKESKSLHETINDLISLALELGGQDNITAVLIQRI